MPVSTWREAMERALYGPDGFFVRQAPASQFRTSVHASSQLSTAIATLVHKVDAVLGHPDRFDIVDIGAGRGELLEALRVQLADPRLRFTAVEIADRPPGLSPDISWLREVPTGTVGLVVATEWLDNVPVDVVGRDGDGVARLLLTDGTLGPAADPETVDWLAAWWPDFEQAEAGLTRDRAWRSALAGHTGLALAVDYGHTKDQRPFFSTLTGYREGRQVQPAPDGSTDITAHVAMDSLSTGESILISQRDALRALGITGARPPLSLASSDPRRYLRALVAATEAAELTDPAGLGGHWWLLEGRGVDVARCFP
ncbi:SAM-dependent methyltransferase [Longispora fulva]|uniref:SAM-dependent MidA family methyltransferase n=1 Tax=Longispora fulva TaxID=619741 RepID=A0A8J7GLX4_9ACTN|nr:SAM-dependent methyltransferase [Longispora fulva]MBG6139223.1 SAM-dependent MidA family methyltransferase [Longispora fulva]